MIAGYWTALCCIMLSIMILTGWDRWIDQFVKLSILIPSIVLLWLGQGWNVGAAFLQSTLTINASFIFITCMQALVMLTQRGQALKQLPLHAVVLALSLTLLRAFAAISPWAGVHFTLVNLALASGVVLVLFKLNASTYAVTLYWGAAITELLFMWQQKGEYNGAIGSMLWWDYVTLALAAAILFKTILAIVKKITLNFVHSFGKRMKS